MVGREGEGEGESDEGWRIVGRFVGGLLWATWFCRETRKERGFIIMLSNRQSEIQWAASVGADAHCRGGSPVALHRGCIHCNLSTCPLASLSLLAPPPPTKRRDGSRAQMQGPLSCTVSGLGERQAIPVRKNT